MSGEGPNPLGTNVVLNVCVNGVDISISHCDGNTNSLVDAVPYAVENYQINKHVYISYRQRWARVIPRDTCAIYYTPLLTTNIR